MRLPIWHQKHWVLRRRRRHFRRRENRGEEVQCRRRDCVATEAEEENAMKDGGGWLGFPMGTMPSLRFFPNVFECFLFSSYYLSIFSLVFSSFFLPTSLSLCHSVFIFFNLCFGFSLFFRYYYLNVIFFWNKTYLSCIHSSKL